MLSESASSSSPGGQAGDYTPGLSRGYKGVSSPDIEPAPTTEKSHRALAGLRVLEFAVGLVGPYSTRLMALLGAQVIRVESHAAVDGFRVSRNPLTLERLDFEGVPRYNYVNLNKHGVSINLRHPQGIEMVKRLIAVSDIMLENFSAGVIDRLGLGYEVVKEIRPDIIMVSASGSGRAGPEAGFRAVATVFASLAGLAEMTGYPDDAPHGARSNADTINALTIYYSVMAALYYRKRTGLGQYIDYSSREGMACLVGDSLMDYTMNGRAQTRQGNRDSAMAPHNCYRCQGEDRWVSIAIGSEGEWQSLIGALGHPAWAMEERFATALGRWEHQEELDQLIESWTINYTPNEVTEGLQRVGVAAAPSNSAGDIYTDPHIGERGVLEVVEHPKLGANLLTNCPWKLSATPPQITSHGPFLGQHNGQVFGELLGLSEAEVRQLEEAKVLW